MKYDLFQSVSIIPFREPPHESLKLSVYIRRFFFPRGSGKTESVAYDICVELNNRIYGSVTDRGTAGGTTGPLTHPQQYIYHTEPSGPER